MFRLNAGLLLTAGLTIAMTGCTHTSTSNTARTAKEQMLLSNAVDQSLDKVDFTPLYGQKVFVDDKYLECVDKNYEVCRWPSPTTTTGSSWEWALSRTVV